MAGPLDLTYPPDGDPGGDAADATANAAIGATTDAANTTGTTGTISGKLRGLITILASVWDSVNNLFKVSLATRIAGEDLTNDVQKVEERFNPTRLTADGIVKNGAGLLHTITIAPTGATVTAGVFTVYDNSVESGTVIYSEYVPATLVPHTVQLDVALTQGAYIGFDGTLAGVNITASAR